MRIGRKFAGPAIVTEYSATTVVPPKAVYFLDDATNLIINFPSKTKGAHLGAP
jgi:N-methylhydantoinase A/oxoprolinase/acetone carboxylase beta subunit